MAKGKAVVLTVLEERGWKVRFSNQGTLPKENPTPVNWDGHVLVCRERTGLCQKKPRANNRLGVCSLHSKPEFSPLHSADWVSIIVDPAGTEKTRAHSALIDPLFDWFEGKRVASFLHSYIDESLQWFFANVPDATTLQEIADGASSDAEPAETLVARIGQLVDLYFIPDLFDGVPSEGLPLRVAAAAFATGVVCEEANRGDAWYCSRIKGKAINPTQSGGAMALTRGLLRSRGIPKRQVDKVITRGG